MYRLTQEQFAGMGLTVDARAESAAERAHWARFLPGFNAPAPAAPVVETAPTVHEVASEARRTGNPILVRQWLTAITGSSRLNGWGRTVRFALAWVPLAEMAVARWVHTDPDAMNWARSIDKDVRTHAEALAVALTFIDPDPFKATGRTR